MKMIRIMVRAEESAIVKNKNRLKVCSIAKKLQRQMQNAIFL